MDDYSQAAAAPSLSATQSLAPTLSLQPSGGGESPQKENQEDSPVSQHVSRSATPVADLPIREKRKAEESGVKQKSKIVRTLFEMGITKNRVD